MNNVENVQIIGKHLVQQRKKEKKKTVNGKFKRKRTKKINLQIKKG